MRFLEIALIGVVGLATPAVAQIDYRNLDPERPTVVEDAYPIEQYAFEFLLSYRGARSGGAWTHVATAELTYGLGPGIEAGIGLPIAYSDHAEQAGVGGFQLSTMINLHNETEGLPGLGVRLDAVLPLGSLGPDGVGIGLKALGTRSFGRNRLHVNGTVALVTHDAIGSGESVPTWSAGVAVDHSFLRTSTLVLAEIGLVQELVGESVGVNALLGVRRQIAPTLVLDAGVGRCLRCRVGPPIAFTVGLSHGFAFADLLPGKVGELR